MRITEHLAVEGIVSDVGTGSLEEILRRLVAPLCGVGDDAAVERALAALLAREALGSTGIGEGVALPHARLPGIGGLSISLGRSAAGVDYGAVDGEPVFLFFMILAPEQSSALHLRALAKISRIVRDNEWRERILAAPDAEGIYRVLREADGAF